MSSALPTHTHRRSKSHFLFVLLVTPCVLIQRSNVTGRFLRLLASHVTNPMPKTIPFTNHAWGSTLHHPSHGGRPKRNTNWGWFISKVMWTYLWSKPLPTPKKMESFHTPSSSGMGMLLGDFGLMLKWQRNLLTSSCGGTPEYLAYDAWNEKVFVGPRYDIWGAGCTLWELVTGNMAFEQPSEKHMFGHTLGENDGIFTMGGWSQPICSWCLCQHWLTSLLALKSLSARWPIAGPIFVWSKFHSRPNHVGVIG